MKKKFLLGISALLLGVVMSGTSFASTASAALEDESCRHVPCKYPNW